MYQFESQVEFVYMTNHVVEGFVEGLWIERTGLPVGGRGNTLSRTAKERWGRIGLRSGGHDLSSSKPTSDLLGLDSVCPKGDLLF